MIISNAEPALVLAPMEGVTDAPMRALMTERFGFSHCVTEFLRISQNVPPDHIYQEHAPELLHDSKTSSGQTVFFQILGGDAEKLALAAQAAAKLGAAGIDLNFGCPAPTVNKHDGGATLLKHPARIQEIVSTVRQAVPAHLPVSAKIRLGWDDINDVHVNAERAALGGASWITIHARTRTAGYKPPVYWKPIGEVRRNLSIPVIANGDIWTFDDFRRCQDDTGSKHFMLGRAALCNPFLVLKIARELGLNSEISKASVNDFPDHAEWIEIFNRWQEISREHGAPDMYILRRLKQWTKMIDMRGRFELFHQIKTLLTLESIERVLNSPEVVREILEHPQKFERHELSY